MKKVAVIYTVPSVYASFPELIRNTIPNVEIANTVDEFLSLDPNARGEFTINNLNRLHMLLRCAEMTGAGAIVTSCSTLTPHVEKLRMLIETPIVTIDGAMFRAAASMGTKVAILATARSAVGPAREGLAKAGSQAGKELDIEDIVNDEAFAAVKRMEIDRHDTLVLESAAAVSGRDVIILAQASMAHLEKKIEEKTGIPTLSGPRFCMEELKHVLGA